MMRALAPICAVIALLAIGAQPAPAQTADDIEELKAEIQALKQGQKQMREDLAVIRKIFEQAARGRSRSRAEPSFSPVDLAVGDSPFLGDEAAPVTLIEFGDYQCPYCKRHFSRVMPELVESYVETGKLKYVMREFPIESLHPQAPMASQAALCAGEQDAYWKMHDLIFENQKRVSPAELKNHAATIGLDTAAFTDCLQEERYAARIQKDLKEGAKLGVRGTPSFLLGTTDPEDPTRLQATRFIRGAQPLTVFRSAIEELLNEAASSVQGKS